MRRSPIGFSHAPGGGNRPLTKMHIVMISTLLVGIFVVAPLVVWLEGWFNARRTRVEVSTSPRLARAEAALRDLDACEITYDRQGLDSGRGVRYLDVLFLKACGAAGVKRYPAPQGWQAVGHRSVPFRLERDSGGEAWRVHGLATPDELAKALEEASPALHERPM